VSQRVRPQVLVLDADPASVALVAYHLARGGCDVHTVVTVEEALSAIRMERPDLMVLDVMLPGRSDFEVLAEIRRSSEAAHLPVVVLTARNQDLDRVEGLELGADDYLAKPFHPRELILRVHGILRRVGVRKAENGQVLRAGPVVVDMAAHTVTANGTAVGLTPTEMRLLAAFVERKGRVQTRRQLLASAWGEEVGVETRTVDMHVQRLRAKLGTVGGRIETVRGFGYRFRGD
jgi:two-component system, OmpR family, phosphate regulon response regulator PhoB